MARPWRVEYEGAYYHVLFRENEVSPLGERGIYKRGDRGFFRGELFICKPYRKESKEPTEGRQKISEKTGCYQFTNEDVSPTTLLVLPHPEREAPDVRRMRPNLETEAMEEFCLGYRHGIDQLKVTPLLSSACLILDFLCIHPLRDGNGRVSRLLTLLALYHNGYRVGRYISHERIVEQTKEDYYEALKTSSAGWHDGEHDVMPWFNYLLSIWRKAYREFEERAGRQRPQRGSKTEMVECALNNMISPFGIADVEQLCPNVSRDTIRLVMNRWREQGRVEMLGKGRDAKWRRKG